MTASSLRALAKDHANGILDKEAYRKARDAYLEAVLSGQVPVMVNEYRPLVLGQELETTFEKTAINVAPPPVKEPPLPRPTTEFVPPDTLPFEPVGDKKSGLPAGLLAGAIAISVIIVAILLGLMILSPEDTSSGSPDDTAISNAANPETETVLSAEELIGDFLRLNDWSEHSLQQFSGQWNSLSTEDQTLALTSPQMTRLSNAIYQQLVEIRSGLGQGDNGQIVARQQALVDFASFLGISDPRLVVRELEPASPLTDPSATVSE